MNYLIEDTPGAGSQTRRAIAFSVIVVVLASGCGGALSTVDDTVGVGASSVTIRTTSSPNAGRLFINLHDDEDTSVEAAQQFVRRRGGAVVELRHTGDRNLSFRVGDEVFVADPNRIFTPLGRTATLDRLSRVDAAADRAVKSLADSIVGLVDRVSPAWVITIHNNTNDNYALTSYLPGGPYVSDARAIHRNPAADPDDFYFVTDAELYLALARRNENVVLQSDDAVTDDGSLSVYSAERGLRYVNVEAQHGKVTVQRRMISRLVSILDQLRD